MVIGSGMLPSRTAASFHSKPTDPTDLADAVFITGGIPIMFSNWNFSDWIDPPSYNVDLDDKEPIYTKFMHEAQLHPQPQRRAFTITRRMSQCKTRYWKH
jgi:hypothetical protein